MTSAGNISRSNVSVIFLPGTHVLENEIGALFQNTINLQLLGSDESVLISRTIAQSVIEYGFEPYIRDGDIAYIESSAVIACDSPSGFMFANITNLIIANLTIRGCGFYSPETVGNASVHMFDVTNLLMDTVSIQNSSGYGLLGVNVLGQSQVLMSSFVGNNQLVKSMLNRTTYDGFQCDGNTTNSIPVYTNDGSLDYASVAGGNMYLQYQDVLPSDRTQNKLSFSSCLFSLGIDGTFPPFAAGIWNSKCWLDCPGTGLTIFMDQSFFTVDIIINSSTFYRNQALFGANMYLKFNSIVSQVTIINVSSMYASGEWSGLLLEWVDTNLQMGSLTDTITTSITNSTFSCNISPDNDTTISIFLYKPNYNLTLYLTDCSFDHSALDIYALNTQTNFYLINCSFEQSDTLLTTSYGALAAHVLDSNFSVSSITVYGSNASPDCSFLDSSFYQADIFIKGSYTVPNILITSSTFKSSDIITVTSDMYILQSTLNITDSYFEMSHVAVSGYPLQSNAFFANCNFLLSNMDAYNSYIYLSGNVNFTDNVNTDNGGAISLYASTLIIEQSTLVQFINNTAANGGAMYIDGVSFLNMSSPTNVTFLGNTALLSGGAIYVESLSPYSVPHHQVYTAQNCFIQLKGSVNGVGLYFEDNKAGEAGSVIYGGSIDTCKQNDQFQDIFIIGSNDNTSSLISSEPKYICPCGYGTNFSTLSTVPILNVASLKIAPCNTSVNIGKTVYPGEKIQLQFVTIGQANGTAPGIILIYTNDTSVTIISALRSTAYCNIYDIPFKLANANQYLTTQMSFSGGQSNLLRFNISITVLPCPTGFVLDKNSSSCKCEQLLLSYNFICDINTQTVTRSGSWVGPIGDVLGLNLQCPYDYCNTEGNINVTEFDSQCAYNRQKVLCGQCQEGLSMTFGTSVCRLCNSYNILLVVPFALLGILLVGFIFILNLTVSNGSLNGLIFYANIIRINENIFFPKNRWNNISQFLSIFIAWLNLDFGIEACFYNGMDSYAKTWLQFVFPIYIFSLVGIIVLAGRYSLRISRLFRRSNAVSVLASLILLSYSKVLRTVIIIFSSASITTLNTTVPRAWLYDGNIEFLGPKHTVLFIVGLGITILCIFPYIATLLFIPWLQSRSHWKALRWVNHLKPFFDSYAAPYKDQYRFWFGILLVVRLPLYLLFSLEYSINVRLLAIVIAAYCYTAMLSRFAVYKKWTNMISETFFQMNLMVLATAHLFETNYDTSLGLSAILSVGIGSAFICFVTIVVLHIYSSVRKDREGEWSKFKMWVKKKINIMDTIPMKKLDKTFAAEASISGNYNARETLLFEN